MTAIALILATGLSGCGGMNDSQYENVPAGYVAKLLTPTGWQGRIIEAGQVNLGGENMDGRSNQAVFLEASAVQVKEAFAANQDGQDHRIITLGGEGVGPMPVAVDVYLRLRVPDDERLRNRVFAEITPDAGTDPNDRMSWISVQQVYNRFVLQEARSIIRKIVGKYADDRAINANRAQIEQELTTALLARLRELRVPLELQSVSLSNVTPDPLVQANRSQQAGAEAQVSAINSVGAALRNNPGYVQLEQIRAMERVASEAARAGKPSTFVIGIDGPGGHAWGARAAPQ